MFTPSVLVDYFFMSSWTGCGGSSHVAILGSHLIPNLPNGKVALLGTWRQCGALTLAKQDSVQSAEKTHNLL